MRYLLIWAFQENNYCLVSIEDNVAVKAYCVTVALYFLVPQEDNLKSPLIIVYLLRRGKGELLVLI